MNRADNSVAITAYTIDGKLVDSYSSMNQAGIKLFIKNGSSKISNHIYGGKGMNFKKKATGIKSYKTGIKYCFSLKNSENG